MAISNMSPWSLFSTSYTTESDWSSYFNLSADGDVLSITSPVSGTRYIAYYTSHVSAGDVLEFEVEAASVSGEQSVFVQVGTLTSLVNDAFGNYARSLSVINDAGNGFLTYRQKIIVPETVLSSVATWGVGARSADIGVAQFRKPKMFINGRQIGFPALPGVMVETMGGAISNYATMVMSNSIDYSHAQSATKLGGDPFTESIGGSNLALKVVGTTNENSSLALIRYGSGDTGPGVVTYRTAAAGPGLSSSPFNNGDEIGKFSSYYNDGTNTILAGRFRFFYIAPDRDGTVFSLLTPPSPQNPTEETGLMVWIKGDVSPRSDGLVDCGTANRRWNNVRASNGSIVTSDARVKDNILPVDDAVMRAWGRVNFKVFQYIDSINRKGEGNARLHVGVIAQEVRDAFAAEGLDAARYGLYCYDAWEKCEQGGETLHEAGDLYGIRYEEALALECAYQRWKMQQLEARVAALESNAQ